uniref:BBSome complex member BBS5 PH domain-containing protein n=1 Tax=Aureoumbra lagunensis TaxID=44058 RepID=A0A7S3K498_9STRA
MASLEVGRHPEILWQDREVRFDLIPADLQVGFGEKVIESALAIEDTKSDQRGSLSITNLRIIWLAQRKISRPNLSIGHNCIANVQLRTSKSKQRGITQLLYLGARINGSTTAFEFIFTSANEQAPRIFSTAQKIIRAYENTKLYRDLRLRLSIIRDNNLILLPQEEIFSQQRSVWNLSADKGNLGSFYVTNIRIVWHANNASNFNVSLPYLQMKSVRIQQSKFGQALVLETTPRAGGYVLGFRIDPKKQLEATVQEINSMRAAFTKRPILGIFFHDSTSLLKNNEESVVQHLLEEKDDELLMHDDDDFIYQSSSPISANKTAYLVGDSFSPAIEIIQDPYLGGLAIEKPPDGVNTKTLWRLYLPSDFVF